MQAVILAAGQGLRLRPITNTTPKGLVIVAGKPLLQYTLEALPSSVSKVFIVTGYLGEQIREHFGSTFNGLDIQYVTQDKLLGTGDAVHLVQTKLENNFLVLNGDDIYNKEDLEKIITHDLALLAVESNVAIGDSIEQNNRDELVDFSPSRDKQPPYLVNCGAYMLNKKFFKYPLVQIPVREFVEYSLPHTLAILAKDSPVTVVQASTWLPIGTPEQLEQANTTLANYH